MNNVMELIGNHRSIRKFTDKKITEESIKQIFEKAQFASTSSYVQAYSVIRVKNPESRKKIALWSGEQKYVETASDFFVFCADMKRLELATIGHNENYSDGYTESFIIATVDTALYGQNVMLCAESLGLGGVFIGGIRNNPEKICELLGLPQNVYPVFGMCLGFPDQNPGQKPRLPLEAILKNDTYSEDNIEKLCSYDEVVKEYYLERTRGKVNHTWTEQMAEKMKGELRPHMKGFLEKWNFIKR